MTVSRTEAERSRTWASRRAFGIGFVEYAVGATPWIVVVGGNVIGLGKEGALAYGNVLHSLPLLHELPLTPELELGSMAILGTVAIRGLINMIGKSINMSVGPDSARDYYESASKRRRNSLGLANFVQPFDFWKAKYPTA